MQLNSACRLDAPRRSRADNPFAPFVLPTSRLSERVLRRARIDRSHVPQGSNAQAHRSRRPVPPRRFLLTFFTATRPHSRVQHPTLLSPHSNFLVRLVNKHAGRFVSKSTSNPAQGVRSTAVQRRRSGTRAAPSGASRNRLARRGDHGCQGGSRGRVAGRAAGVGACVGCSTEDGRVVACQSSAVTARRIIMMPFAFDVCFVLRYGSIG